jgi:hypothetical protein
MLRVARRFAATLLATVLVAGPTAGQSPADPRLAKGIGEVDQGDYDAAIVTLDELVREWAGKPGNAKDLAQAYVYLGVAYLAKGHETAAKARFREALMQSGDLRLGTDQFAPRVVELFEKAREESRQQAPAAPDKKGGSSKTLLVVLGGAAAAGGAVALAAGGGTSASPPPATSPQATSPPQTQPLSFPGLFNPTNKDAKIEVGPFRAGPCQAELSWSDGRTRVDMFVVPQGTSSGACDTRLLSTTSSVCNWTCVANVLYRIDLFMQPPYLDITYQLRVTPPQ